MTREQITTHFKLNAEKNLKTGGINQAYLQGAEDCYDYIKENEENKISLNCEAKCNELQEKMNCIIHTYEEKLQARENEIKNLRNKEEVLRAKLEVIEMIFGKK